MLEKRKVVAQKIFNIINWLSYSYVRVLFWCNFAIN